MVEKEKIKKIAKLARLGTTQEEEESFAKDFSLILDYFKSLEELKTSEVKPTFHPTEGLLGKNVEEEREDELEIDKAKAFLAAEKIRSAFPEREKKFLKVKSVFD
ncbi:MAG TPA: Asp-tRNA(Asn)/Glu-tRNA(Gln) amidotransferase subunit GatC [Candidatus Parcubacteria bacterium]|nr:Asp-tRNA(Asn)/Glu-tRNA(Gln) amidotransferase subunit GatC [Candidatus Parcubacteria bacterium]